ncbi:MAG: hypothetical protein FWE90_08540 [Defluviitaleaceae bacterium]|nr:hypothetical protein [Defluviitaleaceae bacterium]
MDISGIKLQSARNRKNLVTLGSLANPGDPVPAWDAPYFDELIRQIKKARANQRPVILSMGAHVIKCGLSRYLIALMQAGWVTHIASNGAGSIHDFELCGLGGTSEDVKTAIQDGTFGMWEETCIWMNEAINEGAALNIGYGESLARYMDVYPERFPFTADCVLYQAYKMNIPATYHIALGTDIIHQSPNADFSAIGKTSGIDFHTLCESVSRLDGGVYLNFGSAVIGPEVFLKALSVARNLGYPTADITAANFDLFDAGDQNERLAYHDPRYYYRPLKNIVTRPTVASGRGRHFTVCHTVSIPNLYKRLTA